MTPPRIPGSISDYRRDCPGWIHRPLPNKIHVAFQNIACHHCYAHGHNLPNFQLPYSRRKDVIANFKRLRLAQQE